MNIFVGNLNTATTEEHLRGLFTTYGRVASVKIIKDFDTDTSRGYGFVEMDEKPEASLAINKLNKSSFMDQEIDVSEATPRPAPQNSFTKRGQDNEARNNSMKRRR